MSLRAMGRLARFSVLAVVAVLALGFRRGFGDQVQHVNEDSASTSPSKRTMHSLLNAALALVVAASMSASHTHAVPVVGWQCDMTLCNCDDDEQIQFRDTNSPIVGDGTENSADDFVVWGSTPSSVHLDPNFEAVLNGRVRFIGAAPGSGRDFRWGMFKRVGNGSPSPTGAWLGPPAGGGSGGIPR